MNPHMVHEPEALLGVHFVFKGEVKGALSFLDFRGQAQGFRM